MFLVLLPALAASPAPLRKDLVKYPPGGEGDAVCQVALVIGEDGKSDGVLITGCGARFEKEARASFRNWRWEPEDPPISFWQRFEVKFNQSQPYARIASGEREAQPFSASTTPLHKSEMGPSKGMLPAYPPKADGTPATCRAVLWVRAETGATEGVFVEKCDDIFLGPTERALLDWTYAPKPEATTEWLETREVVAFEKPPPEVPLKEEEWSALLTLDSTVDPVPPKKWKKLVPATCRVTLTVRESSNIEGVEVSGCDESFHAPTENAVRRWKFTHQGAPETRWIETTVAYENPRAK